MTQIVQVDFTIFRLVATVFFFLVSAGGILITVGRVLNKQKNQCTKIKTLEESMWDKGRPLLQSVKVCKEERGEFKESCKEILRKLDEMDLKQDESNALRSKQIVKIRLHMQKIDSWYMETHKG